ncbi:hypothetical protein KZJ38_05955 [Paraburkholderia edwinii]|uniref:Uncharacterized protein n=1 Tax=Paraburkholderia edwinii TaxID=2861782 RepID=A0ABX8UR84_9BURK|nr:hypothetical protein [Paraburkholderia edwinii]QYD71146.1 hypothetical protein KZJ38_05955 [Paraburkholderia edwinii]
MSTAPLRNSKKGDFLGDIAFGKKFCVFYRGPGARRTFSPELFTTDSAMGEAMWVKRTDTRDWRNCCDRRDGTQ